MLRGPLDKLPDLVLWLEASKVKPVGKLPAVDPEPGAEIITDPVKKLFAVTVICEETVKPS